MTSGRAVSGPAWLGLAVAAVAAVAIAAVVILWPRGEAPSLLGDVTISYVDATVDRASRGTCPGVEALAPTGCQRIEAEVTSGEEAGRLVSFTMVASDFSLPDLAVGDQVVLARNASAPPGLAYSFADFQRSTPILALAVVFAVAVVVLAGLAGLRALVGLAAGVAVVLVFIVPALLRDRPPVAVALAGAVVIAFVAIYLTHGVSWPSTIALASTILTVAAVSLLGAAWVHLASFTALSDDAAQVLRVSAEAVDLRGLLVAGIVIGALGVIDDVTVTQVAAVSELRAADPEIARRDLYRAASRIGRDHVAATVNTLVLAYVGASLPLVLLFATGSQPLSRVATSEVVAVELVRMLVGSIGIVASVPVTTALATVVLASTAPASTSPGPPHWEDFGPTPSDPGS